MFSSFPSGTFPNTKRDASEYFKNSLPVSTMVEVNAMTRKGAKIGDIICVTNTFGDSGAGLDILLKEEDYAAAKKELLLVRKIDKGNVQAALYLRMVEENLNTDSSNSRKKKKNESLLDQFSRDLTAAAAEGLLDPVVGRDKEVLRTVQILSRRSKNNPVLIGEPGVGKTLMAKCFIKACKRPTFTIRKDLPDGDFVKHIKNTFDKARDAAPSIVFLDDMDKFANEDVHHRNAEEFVTIQSCIDDCKDDEVFVLAFFWRLFNTLNL